MLSADSAEAVHDLTLPSALCHVPGQEGTMLAASGPAAQGAAAKLQLEGNCRERVASCEEAEQLASARGPTTWC